MICGKSAQPLGYFAARGGATQNRTHGGDDAREHFAVVEFGELGEAAAFRDHQADDVLAAGLVDLAHEQIDELSASTLTGSSAAPIASMACRPSA